MLFRLGNVTYLLPSATHCHTHYPLHPFHFVFFKPKISVAKQHPTSWAAKLCKNLPYREQFTADYDALQARLQTLPEKVTHDVMVRIHLSSAMESISGDRVDAREVYYFQLSITKRPHGSLQMNDGVFCASQATEWPQYKVTQEQVTRVRACNSNRSP